MRARRVAPVLKSATTAVVSVALAIGAAQLAAAGAARADTSGNQPTGLHEVMMPAESPDAATSVGAAGAVVAAAAATVGPDVASYQHPGGAAIDWAQVAASGQTFAIVKATELYSGSDGVSLCTPTPTCRAT